jgi:hypothetical protein
VTTLPHDLPARLRRHGLTVREVPGWKTRGRPASTGGFAPVGVLCHHTATGRNWTDAAVVNLLVRGRPDLPGPLSQLGLDRAGTVHIVAAGRCNHADDARASGTVAAGDGNRLYIGIEAFNDGRGEPYPAAQYAAYVRLCAALSVEVTGNSVQTVRGHKETSTSGKPDPLFDMDAFRAAVAADMKKLTASTVPEEPPVTGNPAPGPTIGLPLDRWPVGESIMHKTPLTLSKQALVTGGQWYTVATLVTPKGGKFLHSLQVRMPAGVDLEAEVELVRLGWPGLAREDSTGHNTVPPAVKWAGIGWRRWRTPISHAIDGGGPVAHRILLPPGEHRMRFVAKATRLA